MHLLFLGLGVQMFANWVELFVLDQDPLLLLLVVIFTGQWVET